MEDKAVEILSQQKYRIISLTTYSNCIIDHSPCRTCSDTYLYKLLPTLITFTNLQPFHFQIQTLGSETVFSILGVYDS
jgi:hypothetical protein